VTPGQIAVAYRGSTVVGGGVISNSTTAGEAAQMHAPILADILMTGSVH